MGGRPRINQLLQSWPSRIDAQERTRRLIDLFVVSVLLDAGAGTKWSYRSKESGKIYSRSEGLAVASLEMFKSGLFSSDPTEPCQVDGAGLQRVTVEKLAKGMQHSDQNSLAGIEGRAGLLVRLADALNNQDFFGVDARPGNMLGESIHQTVGLSWSKSFFLSKANYNILLSRLSAWSSFNSRLFCTYCPNHHSVDCPHGRLLFNLASFSYQDRWRINWRRLGVLRFAKIPTCTNVGKHHSIPQTHSMAVLLHHGPHV